MLLVVIAFYHSWVINAAGTTSICWDREYQPLYEQCCGDQIYPLTQDCPLPDDEPEEWKRKCWDHCDWIKLNTCFPIIWDCIETKAEATNPTNAFPYMIWALTKIVMSVILVVCFILVIVAWIMRSADKPDQAKKLLKRVAITILLLWFSWVILKLVNPNFFY